VKTPIKAGVMYPFKGRSRPRRAAARRMKLAFDQRGNRIAGRECC